MSRKVTQSLDLKIVKAELDQALSKLGVTEPTSVGKELDI